MDVCHVSTHVMQVYLKAEPVNTPIASETRALSIAALATLVYLE